jgi:hypothetical protein
MAPSTVFIASAAPSTVEMSILSTELRSLTFAPLALLANNDPTFLPILLAILNVPELVKETSPPIVVESLLSLDNPLKTVPAP